MTHRRAPLAALLVLPLVLLAAPTHAQEADTTEAAPSVPDTTATDTTQTAPPDPATADTATADETPADTAQVPMPPNTLATDTTAAADTTAVDTALSAEARQKRGVQVRSRLQSPTNRELTRTVYRDSTAQLPGGTPVVALQYSTNFEGGRALEAVVTAKQDAGWKVAGYRVVPAPADSAQAADSTQAPDSTQAQPEPDTTQTVPQADTTGQARQPDSSQVEPDSTQGQ